MSETDETAKPVESAKAPVQIYSCHPLERFKLGRFQFEKCRLELKTQADVQEFEELLAQLEVSSPVVRRKVKTLSASAAEEFVRKLQQGEAINGTATSESLRAANKIAQDADAALKANLGHVDLNGVDPSVGEGQTETVTPPDAAASTGLAGLLKK